MYKVEIGLLHDLAFAKGVGAEPVTSDDWEIIVSQMLPSGKCYSYHAQELHASHVESTLLSQVRVAAVGQEIDIWVLGRTRVRLRVGESVVFYINLRLTHREVSLEPSASGEPATGRIR